LHDVSLSDSFAAIVPPRREWQRALDENRVALALAGGLFLLALVVTALL
jgi:hypothetical protein